MRLRPRLSPLCVALAALVYLLWTSPPTAEGATAPAPIGEGASPSFNRDIRPLLSEYCFACHGPDEAVREADLRLDQRAEALADRGGYAAIVPGAPSESELWLRVSDSADPMPPHDFGKAPTEEERELLRRWIEDGAEWEEHWAFVTPKRPRTPSVGDTAWPRSPIDSFVLQGLEAAGLAPSEEASRETLIRRLSLDLTGLPPTVAEVDAFLEDTAPEAYERLVRRLLSSPRYGETMAVDWLDAARYGDTHGLHLDNERGIWPWRDWVVDAFNSNQPFDRFTIEQIAGDLLPDATDDQVIATGFNRCNPSTAEGGLIEQEYLVKYAVDRASTVGTVWMGMTLDCASCHDHKYDPITQKEFYEFYAFFNSIDEAASDGNGIAPPPILRAPTEEQRAELERLAEETARARAERDAPDPAIEAAQAAWESELRERLAGLWTPVQMRAFSSREGAELTRLDDGSILAGGPAPDQDVYEYLFEVPHERITAVRIEALEHESLPKGGPGRSESANFVLTDVTLEAPLDGGALTKLPLTALVTDYSQPKYEAHRVLDGDPTSGWAVSGEYYDHTAIAALSIPQDLAPGTLLRLRLHFESNHRQHTFGRVRLSTTDASQALASDFGPWEVSAPFAAESATAAYETEFAPESAPDEQVWSERAEWQDGVAILLDGENTATYVRRRIEAPDEREIELAFGSDDALKVWLNGELVIASDAPRPYAPDQSRFRSRLRAGTNELLLKVVNYGGGYAFGMQRIDETIGGAPMEVASALAAGEDASPEVREAAKSYYRRAHSATWRALDDRVQELERERAALEAEVPTTLVLRERAERRQAHVLRRGNYELEEDPVEPGVPAVLPPIGSEPETTWSRLDLAHWLVADDHPLTARVTVNRFWQRLFGRGLVDTPEDFGMQGAWPSHPELLDWLAVEFVESGWDVKALFETIVTSATYRQSSRVGPDLLERDPDNILLARGPRFRLSAEMLRDQALAIAGTLVERLGGPPTRPYQPAGIWDAVAYSGSNTRTYARDAGEALYRRSLYTFWKRTAPPPTMQLFDAPMREACSVRRDRTNTPLQALALMNDVQFVEAARAFAERLLLEVDGSEEERLAAAFRMTTARSPGERELEVLLELLTAQRTRYGEDEAAAGELLSTGELPADPALAPHEVAAWTQVTMVLLNLDETVTKG